MNIPSKSKRGAIGLVVLLISLAIVGYLVYLQIKGKSLPQMKTPEGLPGGVINPQVLDDAQTDPSKTIQHFKNEVQNINNMQQQNLDRQQNPED